MASRRSSGMYGSVGVEHSRVELGEELGVQSLDGLEQILFRHYEAQVQQRSALRDHPHVDVGQRGEDAARYARRVADVVPTRHTMAWSFSISTSAKPLSSLQIASKCFALSIVSDTLTSEVATMSTGVSK